MGGAEIDKDMQYVIITNYNAMRIITLCEFQTLTNVIVVLVEMEGAVMIR